MGLVKFVDYQWLNKIQVDEAGWFKIETFCLLRAASNYKAYNRIYSIICKGHFTQ